jgi:hypothetical protein
MKGRTGDLEWRILFIVQRAGGFDATMVDLHIPTGDRGGDGGCADAEAVQRRRAALRVSAGLCEVEDARYAEAILKQ